MNRRISSRSALVALLFVAGCSPSAGSSLASEPGANAPGTSGAAAAPNTGGGANSANGGGATSGSSGGVFGSIPQDTGSSGGSNGGTCAALTLEPEHINVDKTIPMDVACTAAAPEPIAIYVVLDNSGSMNDEHKWPDAVDAITMFVSSDPTATGAPWSCVDKDGKPVTPPANLAPPGAGAVSVALQYFHPENAGRQADECDGSAHRTPAVPMGPLPANGPNVVSSLNRNSPNGDTPTVGALTGGTEYCADYQTANPGKKCIVVLVTDGQPNACGLSSNCGGNGGGRGGGDCVDPMAAGVLVPIAADSFDTNGVRTFTMGMSGVTADGFNLLDQIAAAGGGDCTPATPGHETCDITSSGAQGFLAALDTIRKTVQVTSNSSQTVTTTTTQHTTLQCEWGIPKPSAGSMFDKQLVNVSFSTAGSTRQLGNVSTQADCAAAHDGWYYDDPANPTRILVCPETCTALQAAADAKVDVLVGCATQPAMVR